MSDLQLDQAVDLSALLDKKPEEKAQQLPIPSGYRILCAIPEVEEEYESGLIKADQTINYDSLMDHGAKRVTL